MKIPRNIILSFIFACIGITTEVFFTAIYELVKNAMANKEMDWSLTGKTYIWMFFIYASIPFLLQILEPFFIRFNLWIKAIFAVFIIYIVEFFSGWILELTTGACPWKYTEGIHLYGFIRLDYFLFWYVFALFILIINQSLNKRLQ